MNKNRNEGEKVFDIKEAPVSVTEFLSHMITEKNRSEKTVYQYYHDLRTFSRYIAALKYPTKYSIDRPGDIDFSEITDTLLFSVQKSDIHSFIYHLRTKSDNKAAATNRKLSAVRSYYKFCINSYPDKITQNPSENIETASKPKRLPKFLTLNESVDLLEAVSGKFYERDYAIVTLFLNCGMRVSELVGLNLRDISFDQGTLRVVGKGNKERILYMNDACVSALEAYIAVRPDSIKSGYENAVFISRNRRRISVQTVQWLIYKYLEAAGFGNRGMSVHKLRHTAATLLYREGGVDVRVLKEILGHEALSTTQIYTHVSDEQIRKAAQMSPLSGERGDKLASISRNAPHTAAEEEASTDSTKKSLKSKKQSKA